MFVLCFSLSLYRQYDQSGRRLPGPDPRVQTRWGREGRREDGADDREEKEDAEERRDVEDTEMEGGGRGLKFEVQMASVTVGNEGNGERARGKVEETSLF